jgi:protein MAK11
LIFGLDCCVIDLGNSKCLDLSFELSFAYPAHLSCIKAVSISQDSSFLASGGTDENIRLYNLKEKKELGELFRHGGSISTLFFYRNSHLLSGSHDGIISLWRTNDWECLHDLKGHKGKVNQLAVHPSGRLALSVSDDKTMRTWNLLTGRCAYITRMPFEIVHVRWNQSGDLYALAMKNILNIYALENSKLLHSVHFDQSINTFDFLSDTFICVGTQGKDIEVIHIESGQKHAIIRGHTSRVKALKVITSPLLEEHFFVISASSDGFIKLWNVGKHIKSGSTIESCVAEFDSKSRLTCLDAVSTVWQISYFFISSFYCPLYILIANVL